MQIDLTDYSRADLENLARDIEKALEQRRKDEIKKVREDFKRIAAAAGVTVEEAMGLTSGGAKGAKTPSAPKYANPNDPSQTWTGKGRQPVWFKDAMQAGISPDSLEI